MKRPSSFRVGISSSTTRHGDEEIDFVVLDERHRHEIIRKGESARLHHDLFDAEVQGNRAVSESENRLHLVIEKLNVDLEGGSLHLVAVEIGPEVPDPANFVPQNLPVEVQPSVDEPGRLGGVAATQVFVSHEEFENGAALARVCRHLRVITLEMAVDEGTENHPLLAARVWAENRSVAASELMLGGQALSASTSNVDTTGIVFGGRPPPSFRSEGDGGKLLHESFGREASDEASC